jgi:hypothetical protein
MCGELHLSKHRLSNENDWEYTFSTINNGVKVSSHKTSKIQSNTRTYNIKNLAGKLGTQEIDSNLCSQKFIQTQTVDYVTIAYKTINISGPVVLSMQ